MSHIHIPVRCGDETHHIDIDPVHLEAIPCDHPVTMERYEGLADLGGDPPQCYHLAKAFNELSAPFRQTPDKFWKFVTELQDFAREGKKELST